MNRQGFRMWLLPALGFSLCACGGGKSEPDGAAMGMASTATNGSAGGSKAMDPGPLSIPRRDRSSMADTAGSSGSGGASASPTGDGVTPPRQDGSTTPGTAGAPSMQGQPRDAGTAVMPEDDGLTPEPGGLAAMGGRGDSAMPGRMDGANAGAGGAGSGTAGSGQPPSAGDGGAERVPTPACALPDCLASVAAQCPAVGACQIDSADLDARYCYANGVQINGGFGGNYTLLKPDGSTCFVLEAQGAPNSFSATYLGASNEMIATAQQDADSVWTIRCAAGPTTTLDPIACGIDPTGIPATGESAQCTPGTCP